MTKKQYSTPKVSGGTASVGGSFVWTVPGASPAAGTPSEGVTFTPSSTNYAPVTGSITLTVNQAAPSIAVATSGTPSNHGQAVTFTATVSGGCTGTVTFYDGGSAIGTGAVNGTTATLSTGSLAVGAHSITASLPAAGQCGTMTSNPINQAVNTLYDSGTVTLTVSQFYLILDLLPEPYRTMVLVAQCTGLRVEEVLALRWENIHFDTLSMLVDRAVVHGRVQRVKTDYSEDELPLDPDFATVLLDWKRRSKGSKLVFTSPVTGRHFHASPAQQDYLRPAGWCLVPCSQCGAAIGKRCTDANGKTTAVHKERRELAQRRKLDNVGWHTFRHTYRSWLDDAGAPIGVQQKLMQHVDIATTAKYGDALMESKRKHNSIVVRRTLGNE
jgi:integrase